LQSITTKMSFKPVLFKRSRELETGVSLRPVLKFQQSLFVSTTPDSVRCATSNNMNRMAASTPFMPFAWVDRRYPEWFVVALVPIRFVLCTRTVRPSCTG